MFTSICIKGKINFCSFDRKKWLSLSCITLCSLMFFIVFCRVHNQVSEVGNVPLWWISVDSRCIECHMEKVVLLLELVDNVLKSWNFFLFSIPLVFFSSVKRLCVESWFNGRMTYLSLFSMERMFCLFFLFVMQQQAKKSIVQQESLAFVWSRWIKKIKTYMWIKILIMAPNNL